MSMRRFVKFQNTEDEDRKANTPNGMNIGLSNQRETQMGSGDGPEEEPTQLTQKARQFEMLEAQAGEKVTLDMNDFEQNEENKLPRKKVKKKYFLQANKQDIGKAKSLRLGNRHPSDRDVVQQFDRTDTQKDPQGSAKPSAQNSESSLGNKPATLSLRRMKTSVGGLPIDPRKLRKRGSFRSKRDLNSKVAPTTPSVLGLQNQQSFKLDGDQLLQDPLTKQEEAESSKDGEEKDSAFQRSSTEPAIGSIFAPTNEQLVDRPKNVNGDIPLSQIADLISSMKVQANLPKFETINEQPKSVEDSPTRSLDSSRIQEQLSMTKEARPPEVLSGESDEIRTSDEQKQSAELDGIIQNQPVQVTVQDVLQASTASRKVDSPGLDGPVAPSDQLKGAKVRIDEDIKSMGSGSSHSFSSTDSRIEDECIQEQSINGEDEDPHDQNQDAQKMAHENPPSQDTPAEFMFANEQEKAIEVLDLFKQKEQPQKKVNPSLKAIINLNKDPIVEEKSSSKPSKAKIRLSKVRPSFQGASLRMKPPTATTPTQEPSTKASPRTGARSPLNDQSSAAIGAKAVQINPFQRLKNDAKLDEPPVDSSPSSRKEDIKGIQEQTNQPKKLSSLANILSWGKSQQTGVTNQYPDSQENQNPKKTNFVEDTKNLFQNIKNNEIAKHKSLQQLLDLTANSHRKQEGLLKGLRSKQAKASEDHIQFLKKSKKKTQQQTKNNFANCLNQLKHEVQAEEEPHPWMSLTERERCATPKDQLSRRMQGLRSMERVQNMILSSAPKKGRKMQDLILDRKELTKQRFPDKFVCDPSLIVLTGSKGIRKQPNTSAKPPEQSIRQGPITESPISPQLVGQPIINQTEWEYQHFYTQPGQAAKESDQQKYAHNQQKPPKPSKRLIRKPSHGTLGSLEDKRKHSQNFIEHNILKSKNSLSSGKITKMRGQEPKLSNFATDSKTTAAQRPNNPENSSKRQLNTDIFNATSTNENVDELLNDDFRVNEDVQKMSELMIEPFLLQKRPSPILLDEEAHDSQPFGHAGRQHAPTPQPKTRSPTGFGLREAKSTHKLSLIDGTQRCLAASRPAPSVGLSNNTFNPHESVRQSRLSMQSTQQSQGNPFSTAAASKPKIPKIPTLRSLPRLTEAPAPKPLANPKLRTLEIPPLTDLPRAESRLHIQTAQLPALVAQLPTPHTFSRESARSLLEDAGSARSGTRVDGTKGALNLKKVRQNSLKRGDTKTNKYRFFKGAGSISMKYV